MNRKTQTEFTPEQRNQFALRNAIDFVANANEQGHAYVAMTRQRAQAGQLQVATAGSKATLYDVSYGFEDRETGALKTGHKYAFVIVKADDPDGTLALRALHIAITSAVGRDNWVSTPQA